MHGAIAEIYHGAATTSSTSFNNTVNNFINTNLVVNNIAESGVLPAYTDYEVAKNLGMHAVGTGYWLSNMRGSERGSVSGTSYYGWKYWYFRSEGYWNHNQYTETWYTNANYNTYYRPYAIDGNGEQIRSEWNNLITIQRANNADYYLYSEKGDWGTVDRPSGYLVISATSANGNVFYSIGTGSNWEGKENVSFGVRPVITLKAGVKTNASADTEFLGQTCWAVK